jgi:hypothetical protein
MAKNLRQIKQAIFTKLNNDDTLKTILGGVGHIVASQPNKQSQYPCVVYSIITDTDFPYNEDNPDSSITKSYFRITIFSKDSSTEQCDNIESRVKQLLHGQRTLDTQDIICYSCFREHLMEPVKDETLLTWIMQIRYKVSWAVK